MEEVIAVLKAQGAVVVDPADIPSVLEPDPAKSFLSWHTCSGWDNAKGKDAACSVVFKYGMKRDFNAWLASLGAAAPVETLTEPPPVEPRPYARGLAQVRAVEPRHLGRDGPGRRQGALRGRPREGPADLRGQWHRGGDQGALARRPAVSLPEAERPLRPGPGIPRSWSRPGSSPTRRRRPRSRPASRPGRPPLASASPVWRGASRG